MLSWRRFPTGVLSACAVLTAGVPAFGANDDTWHAELTRQIAMSESCEVAFISQVVEREIEGRRLIMAKVHCEDQRSFDALRTSDDEAFTFKACEVPDAKTC